MVPRFRSKSPQFPQKVFTLIVQSFNDLRRVGEAVKAKNKKLLRRRCANARACARESVFTRRKAEGTPERDRGRSPRAKKSGSNETTPAVPKWVRRGLFGRGCRQAAVGRGSRVAGRSLLSRAAVDVLFVRRKVLAVFFVVHFARSHRAKVIGGQLAVDDAVALGRHAFGEGNECHFRGAGRQTEHAVATEQARMAHAVETTHQRVAFPHLDTLGQALVVELAEGGHERFAQPSALLAVAVLRRAATVDHTGESRVEGHAITPGVPELAHGMGYVHLGRAQHEARTGCPPVQFAFAFEGAPRENARGVGGAQAFGAHVAADGQKTIGFGQLRIGEAHRIGIEDENHSRGNEKEVGG